MKFLVDNQLPTALAQYLRERGFDCQHVLEAGLGELPNSGTFGRIRAFLAKYRILPEDGRPNY